MVNDGFSCDDIPGAVTRSRSLSAKSLSSLSLCSLSVLCVSVVSVSVSNFTTETQRTLKLHRGSGCQIFLCLLHFRTSQGLTPQALFCRPLRSRRKHVRSSAIARDLGDSQKRDLGDSWFRSYCRPLPRASGFLFECDPGVPLRSTPGFILTPAPQAGRTVPLRSTPGFILTPAPQAGRTVPLRSTPGFIDACSAGWSNGLFRQTPPRARQLCQFTTRTIGTVTTRTIGTGRQAARLIQNSLTLG